MTPKSRNRETRASVSTGTQPRSQCAFCVHYRSPFSVTPFADRSFCAAFPDGIPAEVYGMERDHRKPIVGDHGVQWASKDGAQYPADALAT